MTEPERKLVKGVTLNLGGQDYMVPPLNVDLLEEHAEIIDQLGVPPEPPGEGESEAAYLARVRRHTREERKIIVTLALAALLRNYPEMTEARVRQIIDLGNLVQISAAIMGGSGLQPAGETTPGG